MLQFNKSKVKVFCIGFGKTGTTSINEVFKQMGFLTGVQNNGERLLSNWHKRDFNKIIHFTKTATAFQDIPFSLPYLYQSLDQYYKKAKFILTIRNSSLEWYDSLVKFHTKLWSKDKTKPPSVEDLREADYLYRGFAYEAHKYIYNTTDKDLYNKEKLIDVYNNHNKNVLNYFHSKMNRLIVINVSKKEDYFRLCNFLNKKPKGDNFPWLNKS